MAKEFVAKESTSQTILTNTNTILSVLNSSHAKRYGYRVKISEGSPSGRVEYIHDAVGMTPAAMSFGNSFNYGSWANIWFVRDNFPCMVTFDGNVDYRLKASDYTQRESGASSDVANTEYSGNAMSALPCVWYTRYTEGDYYYFICCEQQYDNTYVADVHTKADGTIGQYDFDAIFKGSNISNKLRSISGVAPQSNTTATSEINGAQACGSKWTIRKWNRWSLIGDLLCLMSKSCNSQAAFGQGHTTGGSSAADFLTTGTLNTAGGFFGYSDTTHAMKVFHHENWWGDRWDRGVGLILRQGQALARMNRVGGDYNLTGEGYTPVGVAIPSVSDKYQKTIISNRYGNLPTVASASGTTYETDGFWSNLTITAVSLFGGSCNLGAFCGSRYLALHNVASSTAWGVGASPALLDPI